MVAGYRGVAGQGGGRVECVESGGWALVHAGGDCAIEGHDGVFSGTKNPRAISTGVPSLLAVEGRLALTRLVGGVTTLPAHIA